MEKNRKNPDEYRKAVAENHSMQRVCGMLFESIERSGGKLTRVMGG